MAEHSKHRSPKVSITQRIVDAAQKVTDLPNVNKHLHEQCVEIQKNGSGLVSTQILRDIYNALRNEGRSRSRLNGTFSR